MFTIKSVVAMFAIAAGGFLNAGHQHMPGPLAPSLTPAHNAVVPALPSSATIAGDAAWQLASSNALSAQLRTDLRDPTLRLRLDELAFIRVDGHPIQGTGTGYITFDGTNELQVDVDLIYQASVARVERLAYQLVRAAPIASHARLGDDMRSAVSDRIGSRLVLEFAHQPVDFSLLSLSELASGKDRLLLSGNGVARFRGEANVFTKFVATVEKATGRILAVQYELLQEIPSVTDSLAVAN